MSDAFTHRLAEQTHVQLPDCDYETQSFPDGRRVMVPLAATEEEKRRDHVAALRRELDGVEFRLAHLEDPPIAGVTEMPNRETVDRTRSSLENTRAAILAELGERPTRKVRGR